ncbi:MAG: hypothetical protein AAGU11_03980 [Syntrophobacteraceae bacterium]
MKNYKLGFLTTGIIVFVMVFGFGNAPAAQEGYQVGIERDCGAAFKDRDYDRDNTLTYEEFEAGRFAFGGPAGIGPSISGSGFASTERSPNSRMTEREFCALVGDDSETTG